MLCPKCSQELPLSSFSLRLNTKGIKVPQSYCKQCYQKISRDDYINNKSAKQKQKQLNKAYLENIVSSYKNKPCKDCHQKYPHYVMCFYHTASKEAKLDLNNNFSMHSKKQIIEEIGNCEVVCSNCFKLRKYLI